MLPFARVLKFGNTVNNVWWSGSDVIMAYDTNNFVKSTGFNTNGFTDYKGKNIVADCQTTTTPFPAIVSTGINNQFGSPGICLYGAGLVVNNSQIQSTLTNGSYTIDMWYRCSTNTATEFIPFMMYRQMAQNDNKWTLWFYFVDGNGARYTNNGNTQARTQSLYNSMITSSWVHLANVYDKSTNTVYFFINGTLVDSFVYNIQRPTTASFVGVGGHVNAPTGSNHSFVDRVRLRTSAVWKSNFNVSTIYP